VDSPQCAYPLSAPPAITVSSVPLRVHNVSATREKLHALTALRFFAAALIVVHHSRGYFGISPTLWAPFDLPQGVSFFFILSGFILTHVYPSLHGIGVRRFLLARFARIWPAYVTALLLLFILLPPTQRNIMSGTSHYSLGTVLLNVSMTQAWVPAIKSFFTFNALSWSISTEFFFYLCFPLLILNWQSTWWYKLSLTFLLICALIVLANHERFSGVDGVVPGLVYINPLGRLFEFTLGMTTALAWRRLAPRAHFSLWKGTLLEVIVVGCVVFCMYYSDTWARLAGRYSWIGDAGALWFSLGGFVCLSFAAMIFVMALGRGDVSRLLSYPLPVLLGEISFSVYLVHQIFIRYYALHTQDFILMSQQVVYALFWLITLLTAYLMWVAVEVPCRRLLVGLWPRRPHAEMKSHTMFADGIIAKPSSQVRRRLRAGVAISNPRWLRGLVAGTLLLPLLLATHMATDASAIPAIEQLMRRDDSTFIYIDAVGDPFPATQPLRLSRSRFPSGSVVVSGWAVDSAEGTAAKGVFVCVDEQTNIRMMYGFARPDVAAFYKNGQYTRTGFKDLLPFTQLAPGEHFLTIKVIAKDKKSYYESPKIAFVIT
jgi:peptidoglycan/LPS O-acetylase OafA/YrhL